jgi:hypothetical protein
MSATTHIDRMHGDFETLRGFLEQHEEISLLSMADANLSKCLLLTIASYFEATLTKHVRDFISDETEAHVLICALVENKAISRQFHTWFNWDSKNANQFFGLFGTEFKQFTEREMKNNAEIDQGVRAFLELGSDRNRLVHQDFGNFVLEKTSAEIFASYRKALKFVDKVPQLLRQFSSLANAAPGTEN